MLRASLIVLGIGITGLLVADLAVTTVDPWLELGRMFAGAVMPDLGAVGRCRGALLNTVTFAFCGTALGVLGGAVLALAFEWAPVRLFCAFIRAIHEIFWAFLFLPLVGLNPVCGIFAIGVPYAGIFAKVYAEIFQELDRRPLAALPGTSRLSRFAYGLLPLASPSLRSYSAYRFECALRSSAVLGFIGLPTVGFHLETAFREGLYAEAAALLYVFYLLVASLRHWLKPRLVPVYVAISAALVARDVTLHSGNLLRFGHEILPWPMRRAGVLDATRDLAFPVDRVLDWAWQLLTTDGFTGIWNTAVLTQIVLAATGCVALLLIPTASRLFVPRVPAKLARGVLIVLRTTPEYILAYIFIHVWGPSMLPAILAIALHNGAILAHLSSRTADTLTLRADAPRRGLNRYFYEVLPRVYDQFLAFLFYRWEVMMRESAILGILGIYTLGFFIDSAFAEDKMDEAFFLILLTAVLNIVIDTISQRVRRNLRLSVAEVETV